MQCVFCILHYSIRQFMYRLFKSLKLPIPHLTQCPPMILAPSLTPPLSLSIPSPSIQPCTTGSLHDRPNQTNKAIMLEISQRHDVLSHFISLVISAKWWPFQLILYPPSSSLPHHPHVPSTMWPSPWKKNTHSAQTHTRVEMARGWLGFVFHDLAYALSCSVGNIHI